MRGVVTSWWRLIPRRVWKRPGESLLAILALGLGIGVSTAMACILQGILARPLPASAAERLVTVTAEGVAEATPPGISPQELGAWRREARGLGAICGWSWLSETFSGDGMSAEDEKGAFVSADFFRVIGTWPARGRAFGEDEERPGARAVVVISDALWRRRYRSDPRVFGRTVVLGGAPAEIIGVMPPGVRLPADGEFWQPLGPVLGSSGELSGLAVRREGVTLAQVRQELRTISEQVVTPGAMAAGSGRRLVVLPFARAFARPSGAVLSLLTIAALAVLLIACANVAVLLLLRSGGRRHELAVRAALGGRPGSIFTLALSEVTLLALGGGVAGLLVAAVCLRLYRATGGLVQASWIVIQLDARALLTVAVAVVVVTAVAGVGPALHAARVSPAELLKVHASEAGPLRSRSAARWLLVSVELCLSSALLVCSFQMIQSVHDLFAFDLGPQPEKVWTTRLLLDSTEHPTQASRMSLFRELAAETRQIPGVVSVAYANHQVVEPRPPIDIELERAAPGLAGRTARGTLISEHFFSTLGRQVIRGRDFSGQDRRDSVPVVIVNESFARHYIAGDPLGRRIRLAGEEGRWAGEDAPAPWRTIVGVAPDLYLAWDADGSLVDRKSVDGVYLPMAQQRNVLGMAVLVRTLGDPAALARSFRAVLQRLAPSTPPSYSGTLAQRLAQATARQRLLQSLLTIFALAALALTGISLYGLVSFLAGRRRREIAIRMSLGARRIDVAGLVARETSLQVLVGSVAGLAISAASARSFSSLLVGVAALDWWLAAGVASLLGGVAVAACFLPVRRALRLDPMANLRVE
jgi:putative ABC transport system permease protein